LEETPAWGKIDDSSRPMETHEDRPSDLCTDLELSADYLDLTGLPPSPEEIRASWMTSARRAGNEMRWIER